MTDDIQCFQCGNQFRSVDGVPLGSLILCSSRCVDTVWQMRQRDYPALPDEEAFKLLQQQAYARRNR